MSLVNWAGSISEISPRRPFLRKKNSIYSTEKPGCVVTEISDFATEISLLEMKIFRNEHSSPGDRDERFSDKIASLSQHSGRNGLIFVWYVFPLQRTVVKLKQSTKPSNSGKRYKFMFHHFGFVSWTASRSTRLKFPKWTDDNWQHSSRNRASPVT